MRESGREGIRTLVRGKISGKRVRARRNNKGCNGRKVGSQKAREREKRNNIWRRNDSM